MLQAGKPREHYKGVLKAFAGPAGQNGRCFKARITVKDQITQQAKKRNIGIYHHQVLAARAYDDEIRRRLRQHEITVGSTEAELNFSEEVWRMVRQSAGCGTSLAAAHLSYSVCVAGCGLSPAGHV